VPALSLVEMDKAYSKLGAYLLDRVYMTDDSIATQPTIPQGQQVVMLTRSGKFIRQDFSLSGGAVGLFEGKKIGRAKNLEKLKTEIEKLERTTYQLHTRTSDTLIKINQLKNATQSKAIDEQRSIINQFSSKQSAAQASVQSLVKFLESSDTKSRHITERLEQLRLEVDQINTELTDLRQNQSSVKEMLEKTDKDFIDLTSKLSEASSRYNQKNIEFHQQQNRVNSISQESGFKQSQIESFQTQIHRNTEVITESQLVIADNQLKLRAIEATLLAGYADKESIEKEVSVAEKTYYDSRTIINEYDAKIRELTRSRDTVLHTIQEIGDKLNDLKLNLTGLRERLNVEFNINVNDIINEELDSKWDKDEIDEDHSKIKKRIEGFGEINPMAVEAYDEMKVRYDFIIAQKKDLEDAKGSLLDTIKEIDDTARTQFLDAFYQVRESFIKVFRTLFSEEDQCDLYLVNPDDPLESKIEIIAKPKGKRPTVIDQLSGGEKTLTATALLFSLYLLKPAPFCIFDEVDAPLDDTNIAKFNKIIQQFSGDSQFIIVTHNKQTMSSVEAIYGVTMIEQGVSRVVPVNFSSLN
jgi:chromosome segregation protein